MTDRPIRIMLIEDSPDDTDLFRDLLASVPSISYAVTHVERMREALRLLGVEPFELILLDLGLPDSQGFDTFARISEQSPDIPIIVLTGLDNDALAMQTVQNGAQDYLVKAQVDGPGLIRAIRYAIERHRAEVALRESEERFRRLAHNAQDIIYRYRFTEPEGFEYVSPSVTRITGYTPEEHYTDPDLVLKFIHPDDRPVLTEMIEGKFAIDVAVVLRWVRKDGRVIWTEQLNTPIYNTTGEIVAIEGISRDISERVQLEEQLRQSQRMDAIGQLAGGVAHDFNNLLTVIIGYSETMLYSLDSGAPFRDHLIEIKQAGERAANLTRQLLAFSRKQILQPRVLDLNELIANLTKMLGRLIGEHIALTTVLNPELVRVKVDPGQLEQVILNLAINARDAMPQGGTLTIETKNVELREETLPRAAEARPGWYARLIMRDTGCGMDAETLAHIFEPFFTTKEPGKGTGLGLSTVYGIVKQSEGLIGADSQPGQGAAFIIDLPGTETPLDRGISTETPTALPRGAETILVVEDEPGVRTLTCHVLSQMGYTTLEASDGEEALQLYERYSGPIHLVVTDVIMPRLSGPALVRRLATAYPGIKVIYISGYTDVILRNADLLDPNILFIQKPFTPATLVRTVKRMLAGENPPGQALNGV